MGMAGSDSSDIGHYEISTTGYTTTSVNGQTTVSTTSLPGPRFIPVYSSGQFQITIQGNYLDVTVAIVTGTLPIHWTHWKNPGERFRYQIRTITNKEKTLCLHEITNYCC